MYAYVHCGEGGLALEMLENMNAAGFPPAMTVPEVLVKVRGLSFDFSTSNLGHNYFLYPSLCIQIQARIGAYDAKGQMVKHVCSLV